MVIKREMIGPESQVSPGVESDVMWAPAVTSSGECVMSQEKDNPVAPDPDGTSDIRELLEPLAREYAISQVFQNAGAWIVHWRGPNRENKLIYLPDDQDGKVQAEYLRDRLNFLRARVVVAIDRLAERRERINKAGRLAIDPIDLYDRMSDIAAGRDVKLFPQQLDLVKRLQAKIDLLREKNRGKIGARLEAIGSWACSVLGHSELSGAGFEQTIIESHEAQERRIGELEQALRAQKCTCNWSSRDLLLEICTPEEIAATGGLPPVMVCDRCKVLSGAKSPDETNPQELGGPDQDSTRPLHADSGIMDDLLIQTQRMRKNNQELRLLSLIEDKLIERKRSAYTECRDLCSGTLRAKMDKLIATLPPKK